MLKIWQNKYCKIEIVWNNIFFKDLRDFCRTEENQNQQKNWINKIFNLKEIEWLSVFIIPFAFGNLIWHTMLAREFANSEKVLLSIEAPFHWNETYSFRKSIFKSHNLIAIRATENDMKTLSQNLRKEKIFHYKILSNSELSQKLFTTIANSTNEINSAHPKYSLIFNNCTTSLRTIIKKKFNLQG